MGSLTKIRVYGVITLLCIFTCKPNKETLNERIKGQWAIKEIKVNDKSYKNQMYSNVLIFEKDDKISIPETAHFKKDKFSRWNLLEVNNKLMLEIKTSNIVFNDTFNINFIKDKEKKLRGVILKSDNYYIEAYKLLQNYDTW